MIRGLGCRVEHASASWVRVCRERRQGGMGGGQWYQPSLQLAQKYTHKQICVGDTHTHTHTHTRARSPSASPILGTPRSRYAANTL